MIELSPVFKYLLAGREDELCPDNGLVADKLWDMLLISKNNDFIDETLSFAQSVTIGDYFLSARRFLEENEYLILIKGLNTFLCRSVEITEIESILISLEKHGPFYHPIKITANLKKEEPVFFVLNGAVSDMGLAVIESEYQNLKELNIGNQNSKAFIPEVYGMGFVESGKGKIGFFLAEWFDNFEEFHVVRADNKNKTGILNKDGSFSFISDSESYAIYEKASEILTLYYDITSLKQIFPWHHAAGDFVVRTDKNEIDVRLITVRGYGALMELDDNNYMLGLFFFFLNLSLRMRIDRNKGTKEYVFLDEIVVQACVNGFINGLKKNQKQNKLDINFFNMFMEFIKEFDLKIFFNLFIMVAGSYNKDAPEASIIEENLETHAKAVFETIKKL